MHSTPHLVSDTFPPSQVGPGGGATIYIYLYIDCPWPVRVVKDYHLFEARVGTVPNE